MCDRPNTRAGASRGGQRAERKTQEVAGGGQGACANKPEATNEEFNGPHALPPST
jgi:hypothetical protein